MRPFAGKGVVSFLCFGKEVYFGDRGHRQPAISWDQFKHSFLGKLDSVVSGQVQDGLVSQQQDAQQITWTVVNPKHFAFQLSSAIPCTQITAVVDGNRIAVGGGPAFGINPMHLTEGHASSTLTITITGPDLDADTFVFTVQEKNMPAALWGDYTDNGANRKQLVHGAAIGVSLHPGKPPQIGETHAVPKENLQYDTEVVKDAVQWDRSTQFTLQASNQGCSWASANTYKQTLAGLAAEEDLEALTGLDSSAENHAFVTAPATGTFA